MRGGMNMQKSGRRARFGRWVLLIWALALLGALLINGVKQEPAPRYDGATFVFAGTERAYG